MSHIKVFRLGTIAFSTFTFVLWVSTKLFHSQIEVSFPSFMHSLGWNTECFSRYHKRNSHLIVHKVECKETALSAYVIFISLKKDKKERLNCNARAVTENRVACSRVWVFFVRLEAQTSLDLYQTYTCFCLFCFHYYYCWFIQMCILNM